jgi:hypothetical protein
MVTGGWYSGFSFNDPKFWFKKMPATGSTQRLAERYDYCTIPFHGYLFQHSYGKWPVPVSKIIMAGNHSHYLGKIPVRHYLPSQCILCVLYYCYWRY